MEYIPSYRDQIQNGSEYSWRDELYHHGIKGMKWGIRRPRNEDGILVGAGKQLAATIKARRQLKKDAKQRYKQKVNADRIAKAKVKATKYQRAAGRDSALRDHLRKQNLGVRVATSYLDLAAAGNQVYNTIQANRYNHRVNRLSN